MNGIGRKFFTLALGILLAVGVPCIVATAAGADPGSGCKCASGTGAGCACGDKCGCGHKEGKCACGQKCAKHEGMHGKDDGDGHGKHMHGKHMAGGGPMKEGMTRHMEEVRGKIAKLREVEARMAGQVKDGEAFRASSLEHAKLLTDLQESHVKHMEGMTGGGR